MSNIRNSYSLSSNTFKILLEHSVMADSVDVSRQLYQFQLKIH